MAFSLNAQLNKRKNREPGAGFDTQAISRSYQFSLFSMSYYQYKEFWGKTYIKVGSNKGPSEQCRLTEFKNAKF